MSHPEPIALCWSGGKDSSLALDKLQLNDRYRVAVLLTTFNEGYHRVSMHGVRRELLLAQAESIGLPLEEVWIPREASNNIYESRMADVLSRLRDSLGIHTAAFGDIFLEDLKIYREKQLAALNMDCLFPLWKRDTRELAAEFIEAGFRGVTTCIDPRRLEASFAGRELDAKFFAELPDDCDPCGENGEFHSFVYTGPNWANPIPILRGEIVLRDSFLFCDLLPLEANTPIHSK